MNRLLLTGIAFSTVGAASAHPGHHFNLKSAKAVTLPSAKTVGTKGSVSADRKSLTFAGKTIRLVVTTGPENDMLSYRIQGLRNPKLVFPKGATVRVLFLNTDEDMPHNFKFADNQPPFESKPALKYLAGSHDLVHRTEKAVHGEELVIAAPTEAGKFSYVCTVPGHAAGGMFGLVVVR